MLLTWVLSFKKSEGCIELEIIQLYVCVCDCLQLMNVGLVVCTFVF